MVSFINTWQFNVIAYLITAVGFSQFFKLAVKGAKNDGAVTVLLQLIAAVISLAFIPLFPMVVPSELKYYLLLAGASVFYAVSDRAQTPARKHLPVSEYAILGQTSRVFLFIFGILIFKEALLFQKVLGVILVIGANILLLYKSGKFVLNKYVWLILLSALSFTIAISIDIGISSQFNLPLYVALTLFIPSMIITFVERIKVRDILNELNNGSKKYYLLTGIFWSLAIIFTLRAFQLGQITTLTPIMGTSVLLNVLVASVFLGEKDHLLKKIIASIIILLGVYIAL